MLTKLHEKRDAQLALGLFTGILFGFLLQKGGVTEYDVIIGQLLLTDFTVVKIMLSAVATGMVGVHLLRSLGLAALHPKPGSFGSSVIGGLVFGIGFGLLGYCPGTLAGAVGQGSLDALFGGLIGALVGAWLFSELYPKLEEGILNKGFFSEMTWPNLLRVNPWAIIIPAVILITLLLFWVEKATF